VTVTDSTPFPEIQAMNAIESTTTGWQRLAERCRRLPLRRLARALGLAAVVLTGFAAVLAVLVLQALEPAPGEWSTTLRLPTPLGAIERRFSMPVLLRWATHPLAVRLLEGRDWHTGTWQLHMGAAGEVRGDCGPGRSQAGPNPRGRSADGSIGPGARACLLQLDALGPAPVRISQVSWQFRRAGPEQWQGSLHLGEAGRALEVAWRAHLRSDGMEIHAELPPAPLAHTLALFADTVPEALQARVDGTLALRLDARWGPRGLQLVRMVPRLDGVRVGGLGTEALGEAAPPASCTAPRRGRIDGWLPKAVVAAVDPRFYERGGSEPELGLPGEPSPHRGTLTGQLARLLYTGEARSLPQSLREWLYAAEMEHTLGKGRILQTYLALAPWGAGVCGAEAASRHYLGKPAERLTPREAVWLASRLVPEQVAGQAAGP
jgi:hypothetical protein